jgi:hypothetical protein
MIYSVKYETHDGLEQLSQALKREWQRIPQVRIQNLIRSLPWRCRIVLTARNIYDILCKI